MKTSMSEFRSQQHHIVSLLATSFCFMAIFLCLPQKVSAQAVGGIPLGSTTDWPIRPALLPFAYANLCQKPNDTGSGQEWRVSTDSIALGVPSVELFGSSQLQEILIIQHCAPAALSPGTFASPHDTFPSLAPISATLPFTALAPLTLANSGMVTSVGILTRSVALPSYPVPVNTMPRLPIGVLEPLLRGVTLVSRDQLPPFTDWKPITDTRLILIHPD